MTELGTHNTKSMLINTTKVTMLLVMKVCRRSNESLRSQGVAELSVNVDQVRLLTCLMIMPPRLWPMNITGRDYSRINA